MARSRRRGFPADLACARDAGGGAATRRRRLTILATVALVLTSGPARAARKPHVPATGLRAISFAKAPPDFTFATGGGTAHLTQYVGRPVVLNFFATWCGPCVAELDAFAALRVAYGERVPVLAISDEAPGVARAFLTAHGIDADVIEDRDRKIFDAYSVQAIPVTLVLARDGTVAHVSVGQLDRLELRDALEPLLDPPRDPPPAPRLDPRAGI